MIIVAVRGGWVLQTLWEYAVATYGRAGVADACLALQDRAGADVNLLLAAAWLAGQGRRWQPAEVAGLVALCAGWRERCVLPLRGVRRYLAATPELAPLYQQAKTLELAAERHQLEMIETWLVARLPAVREPGEDVLRHNLGCYADTLAGGVDMAALVAALMAAPTAQA